MKRVLVWSPPLAILVLAMATACSKAAEGAATSADSGCDLKAASASAAETKLAGCGVKWVDANVAINQLQSMGTHNSYKVAIPDVEMALIRERNPNAAITLDYSHRPISEQLDKGARQLELDPSDDPQGGLFSTPLVRKMLADRGVAVPDYDLSVIAQSGIKVIHVSDIDYRSHCLLFTDCLKQIKAWSDAHPTHTPILVMINPKSSGVSWPGAAKVLPWGKEAFDRMDAEIRSVFSREQMIEPDDVRGAHATLREAVTSGGSNGGGWPKLGEARGKVIFTIDLSPEANKPYAEGHPSLQGRVAFMTTFPDAPEAAYFTMNEPIEQQALIQERVKQGFLIRTRADADTREAREGKTERREAALASGAQFVSTDYLWPDERFGTGYTASLPDGAVTRCNPVARAAGCDVKSE
ncbi:MAG TPA: phosphatidylinositol-specific phospholipase C1-like protein [Hyphomonadaceae bacterium]|nr:phosphatidylinositol-specific phospholipase C1-like protein [Hyphomonadaceae bacterium]